MRFLKKHIFTLAIALLCLSSSNVNGMHHIQSMINRIEQSGQNVVEYVIHSQPWTWICNTAISLGQSVSECESYNGHTYEELYSPSATQQICLAYAQLLGKVCPKVVASRTTALKIDDHGLDCADAQIENNSATKSIIPQSACFTSKQNTRVCCQLYENLSLSCCNENIPKECLSFNMLDNKTPLQNCCKSDAQGTIDCSRALCSDHDAIAGPCSDGGELVNKFIDQTYTEKHHELVKAIKDIRAIKGYGDKWENFWIKEDNVTIIRLNYDEGQSLLSTLSNMLYKKFLLGKDVSILTDYIQNLEQNFKIKSNQAKWISIKNTSNEAAAGIIPKSVFDGVVFILSEHYEKFLSIDFVLGHETAHNNQLEHCSAPPYNKIRPGYEISADILGGLASNYSNLAAIGMQLWFYGQHSSFRNKTRICSIKLDPINRKNAATINNLLQTNDLKNHHPNLSTRSVIMLKLSTMIKTAVKYLEKQEEDSQKR